MNASSYSSNDPFVQDENHVAVKERLRVRRQLDEDVKAFLEQGGKVDVIGHDVRADPPKKPAMNYGSNPI